MQEALPVELLPRTTQSIYRHSRTGRLYALITRAAMEHSGDEVVVYRSLKSGRVWVRPSHEFFDGRYVAWAGPVVGGR